MTDDEFHMLWAMITGVSRTAQVISIEKVRELLDVVSKAQTLGPLLEPTAYIRGGSDNLEDQKVLLKGFLEFRQSIEHIKLNAMERMK